MKINFLRLLILKMLIISGLVFFNSCKNREEMVSCFPNTMINVTLNLNLPLYQKLTNIGGWIYVNEQNSGTRGLILVRTGTATFKAYDRNAPHICPASDTTLEVKDDIKIVCPKDGAEWILLTGQPTKVSQVPPKNYLTYYDAASNVLTIRN
ncbi:hypothetical protein PG275_00160 [Riemerella anatipestifer]|uniref:hypothetical protein n=1 Tax=Riemerella anatipestifer TaxID=34085 RepID=UPI002A89C106|nr:hypothetical protein [Riemerella anatipestifer]